MSEILTYEMIEKKGTRLIKKDVYLKRFIGKGISFKEIFTKDTKKYFPNHIKYISVRMELLCMFEFGEFINEIQQARIATILKNIEYSETYANYESQITELDNIRKYILNPDKEFTYFSEVARHLGKNSTVYWHIYEMCAAYFCFKKGSFGYSRMSDFFNRDNHIEKYFVKELEKNLNIKFSETIIYSHIC